jgi:hypothetical protein
VVLEVAIGWDLERVILVWFCVVKNSVGGDVARARGWGKYKHLIADRRGRSQKLGTPTEAQIQTHRKRLRMHERRSVRSTEQIIFQVGNAVAVAL